jgi:hypothetical protein
VCRQTTLWPEAMQTNDAKHNAPGLPVVAAAPPPALGTHEMLRLDGRNLLLQLLLNWLQPGPAGVVGCCLTLPALLALLRSGTLLLLEVRMPTRPSGPHHQHPG